MAGGLPAIRSFMIEALNMDLFLRVLRLLSDIRRLLHAAAVADSYCSRKRR